jgi:hypothetical protein
VTGGCRKLHNEELHNLNTLPNVVRMIKLRRMRWVGHVAWVGEVTDAYKILDAYTVGKRPLGGPRHRWEDNIKMIWMKGVDLVHLAQVRYWWQALVNTIMNLQVP